MTVKAIGNCQGNPFSTTVFPFHVSRPTGSRCGARPAGSPSPFAFYPIPADASLHVELVDTDSTTGAWNNDPALTTEFQIVDLYGQSWLTQSAPGRTADLPTTAIPTGYYVLRVQRGTRLETTQIAVQH